MHTPIVHPNNQHTDLVWLNIRCSCGCVHEPHLAVKWALTSCCVLSMQIPSRQTYGTDIRDPCSRTCVPQWQDMCTSHGQHVALTWHTCGVCRSSVELDQLCLHECTIIGKGGAYWPQPTYKVVAMDRADEPLLAKSCTGCWTQVSPSFSLLPSMTISFV